MPPEVTNGRGMSFRFAAIGAICFFHDHRYDGGYYAFISATLYNGHHCPRHQHQQPSETSADKGGRSALLGSSP